MNTIQTYVTLGIGLGGIVAMIFTVYNAFHRPDEALDRRQIISEKDIDSKATILAQQEAEGKANLLAQQVTLQKEANEKKFAEIGVRLDTIDLNVANLGVASNVWHLEVSNQLTKLSTIIEERMPRKE